MAVDTSKLRKSRHRGLGAPPIDGSPGIEENTVLAAEITELKPILEQSTRSQVSGTAEGNPVSEPSELEAAPVSRKVFATVGRGREEQGVAQQRQRVPLLEAEPRIPFTTRVSASTKERLEDACHFLRKKHQDFINDAIIAHLEKNGF